MTINELIKKLTLLSPELKRLPIEIYIQTYGTPDDSVGHYISEELNCVQLKKSISKQQKEKIIFTTSSLGYPENPENFVTLIEE